MASVSLILLVSPSTTVSVMSYQGFKIGRQLTSDHSNIIETLMKREAKLEGA